MSESHFKNLIENQESLLAFRNYLKTQQTQSGIDNLNFYVACTDMMKRSTTESSKSTLRLIKIIYRTYFKTQNQPSTPIIAINSHTHKCIRHRIQAMGETTVDPFLFQKAIQEVKEYLLKQWFDPFPSEEILLNSRMHSSESSKEQYTSIQKPCSSGSQKNKKMSNEIISNKHGMKNFHQMLTERLAQLKLPKDSDKIDLYESLASKTNNDLLLKIIKNSSSISIDVEEDALLALESQYNKIGQLKQMETNNNIRFGYEHDGGNKKNTFQSQAMGNHSPSKIFSGEYFQLDYCQKLILNSDCHCYKH